MVYAPLQPELRRDPYPVYRAIRATEPMQYNAEFAAWTLTRHADCDAVLRNPAFSSRLAQGRRQRRAALPPSMVSTDPPEHARLRGPFAAAVAQLGNARTLTEVAGFARDRLERCCPNDAEVDLMAHFARPVATYGLMTLLGLPATDADGLSELLVDASVNLDPLAPAELQRRAEHASTNLREYFRNRIRERRRSPGDDGLTAIVTAADRGGLSDNELLTTCNLLLIGGHDPAMHAIGNAVVALASHPVEVERLVRDGSLLPTAVNELLRFDSPIQLAARVATEDVAVGEATIRRGESVLVLIGAANRDPLAFVDPDRLDVTRRPNPHLAFGAGMHYCLGAQPVRAILATALGELLTVLPRLTVSAGGLRWTDRVVPRGLTRLPVTFGADAVTGGSWSPR